MFGVTTTTGLLNERIAPTLFNSRNAGPFLLRDIGRGHAVVLVEGCRPGDHRIGRVGRKRGVCPANSTKFISASLARHFYPRRNKYWGLGGQVTYAMGEVDETKGKEYDREITGDGFAYPQGPITNRIGDKNYIDANIGGYYGMVTEPVAFEIGGAMYHMFYPQDDVFDRDDEKKLRHRVTAHSMLRLKFNERWGIVQKNYYWQEGMYLRSKAFNADSMHITDFWAGVEFYKTNPLKNTNLNFGLYTRSFRTVMPYLNMYLGKAVNLRASYEHPLNFKKYTAYTAKRAEVAMIFSFKRNTNPGTEFYRKVNFW
ncbi:MAG: type IX secretion system membrane protein PorP/SprF [Chitinophagaceae bacterium]|nr:MAG: type IX secretion system membrane protein PorP/SprF [Chitinophagaceae bacterium]